MAGTSIAHAAYAREGSLNEDDNDIQVRRFQIYENTHHWFLAESAFLAPKRTHDIPFSQFWGNAGWTKRIFVSSSLALSQMLGLDASRQDHGGRITDDNKDADVILTISREEYISLKDKYAISRKTHVRLSGFVDRCINVHRWFQLVPIVEKRVPGHKLMSRWGIHRHIIDTYLWIQSDQIYEGWWRHQEKPPMQIW